jgi:hypothetical protein
VKFKERCRGGIHQSYRKKVKLWHSLLSPGAYSGGRHKPGEVFGTSKFLRTKKLQKKVQPMALSAFFSSLMGADTPFLHHFTSVQTLEAS